MSVTPNRSGFTIVELLIVIVVIGVLAAIVIVAYNGIQNRARIASVTSGLTQYSKKIAVYGAENALYPADLATAGIVDTADTAYQYTVDTSTSPGTYCLTATSGSLTYYVSDSSGGAQQGTCTGYNLLAWTKPSGPAPLPTAVLDAAVYRTTSPSMRIGPSTLGVALRNSPYSGTAGQVYTVRFWMQTDATWNGTAGNSKVRFGANPGGALLYACSYNGPKATWTQVTCNYTLTSTNTSVTITVANDGTVGNIWIDDFSLSRTN